MTREERDLVIAAVDGSLPSGAEERLRELLKRDAEAMEMYAREALLQGELEWHYAVRRQTPASLRRRAEVIDEFRRHQKKRLAVASLGLAAALMMVLAVAAFFGRSPATVVELRFNERAVSQLVRAAGSEENGDIAAGDLLKLERGDVELIFPNGVRAVIEAPAEVEFVEGNALKMQHGTGYFLIDRPQAAGFTLTLPHTEVVDLGTSFGVIAPADGPAEIHLIKGRVLTQRRTGSFEPAAELQPGEAYREDESSETGYVSTPFRNDRFPRRLPDPYEHVAIDFDVTGGSKPYAISGPGWASVREVIANNGSISRVPGRFGNAVRFDRSGSHLKIRGWAESHHRPSGTLSFWIRLPAASHVTRYCPVSWGSSEQDDVGRWSVAIEPRQPNATLAIRAGMERSYHLTAEQPLGYGEWHHIAFVFGPEADGQTEVRTFINGIEDPNRMRVPVMSGPAPDEAFIIGTHHDPELRTSHAFSGDIDDLRIYRSALDAREIAILARGGDPQHASIPTAPDEP